MTTPEKKLPSPPARHRCHYALHVTNIKATEPCPSFEYLRWSLANHRAYDEGMLLYPAVFFTTTLECSNAGEAVIPKKSVYPCRAIPGEKHWRARVPLKRFSGWSIFKLRHPEQVSLILVDASHEPWLTGNPRLQKLDAADNPYLRYEGSSWFTNLYQDDHRTYLKVAIIGNVDLERCIRVEAKLFAAMKQHITIEAIEAYFEENGEHLQWRESKIEGQEAEDVFRFIQSELTGVGKTLDANRCRKYECKQKSQEISPIQLDELGRILAKELMVHVWKYRELRNPQQAGPARSQYIPRMAEIVNRYNAHGPVPCCCWCAHWDTVRKRIDFMPPLMVENEPTWELVQIINERAQVPETSGRPSAAQLTHSPSKRRMEA